SWLIDNQRNFIRFFQDGGNKFPRQTNLISSCKQSLIAQQCIMQQSFISIRNNLSSPAVTIFKSQISRNKFVFKTRLFSPKPNSNPLIGLNRKSDSIKRQQSQTFI